MAYALLSQSSTLNKQRKGVWRSAGGGLSKSGRVRKVFKTKKQAGWTLIRDPGVPCMTMVSTIFPGQLNPTLSQKH